MNKDAFVSLVYFQPRFNCNVARCVSVDNSFIASYFFSVN